ncbi:MAG: hypothetical protein A3B74_01825 [Candidatus Kerfeldbacteria bacterium RIFCSPHIGHO2_02_FULL_42_14]|uniref:Uncharacterized protein n=1 Tax=Candidatus Kerfeldbacteria bacterium RIFCSPHIGHO2_02_FULL_42_14 TaxID=1798540 RepID=A0A1G2AS79_9BACT|nr:MAG: hypothetical protein A3B74_01825 [Candidatus Kerfeldbacteria bacterium RIFCSPHIGHO2_02_FULL_42_14]OGY82251.1 MAG: hypothetical protein A3E60_00155 [Candidatus Kerfeldbacteria bacterium RIFCSPHIGHO2_12_FULL_42_13]OGY82726.1 MAG: hypothetical protein A3I91_01045 [Candidatus Kerfeldbacteria bacterium RIFCSPLOWO2_02_FULL_42_19]
MHSLKKSILLGFLVWLLPFVVAFLIYPIHESHRPIFESIMPLVITISAIIFTYLYFKNVDKNVKAEGAKLGIIFLLISLIIDLIMFMPNSPMHMSLLDYVTDIGLTYLMIPVITIGIGFSIDREKNKK